MAHIDVGSMVARIGNDGAGRFDGGGAAVMMQSQADDASIAPHHAMPHSGLPDLSTVTATIRLMRNTFAVAG